MPSSRVTFVVALGRLSSMLTYICAQHERPGLVGLPVLVIPINELPFFEPVEGLPERPAGNLRLQGERALRPHHPYAVLDRLAVAPGGLYELQVHVAGRRAAHALPFGIPEHPLQGLQ